MRLERVEPERVLAWRSDDGNWVWTFVVGPGAGGTRLISRNRYRLPRLVDRVGMLPMDPRRRCSWSERCCSASSGAPEV
jgi:hypothetical protein